MLLFKKVRKEGLENCRVANLTSVLEKVMEKLHITFQLHEGQEVIGHSQHGFTKSCLTSLITFYDKITGLADDERGDYIAYLQFSKTFGTVSFNIPIEKLVKHRLD